MNDNVSKIVQGVVGLVSELDKLPGVSTKAAADDKVAQLHMAWSEYQDRLRRREHGAVAMELFTRDVGVILGRSQYEFEREGGST